MTDKHAYPVPTEDEIREKLSPEQYQVTQKAGTERAFTGEHWDNHDDGVYRCVVCDMPLFTSDTKFDSGTGWPSFYQPIESENVDEHTDRSFGMSRTEVVCSNCGAHLGHVFPDGPRPTGQRYCMNSCSLRFEPGADDNSADQEPADR
jgi:peptide-methionine (R)-S-oxide reductase